MKQKIAVHELQTGRDFHQIVLRHFRIAEDEIEEPHRHNYYQVLFFDQADGIHEIDFHSYLLQSRSVHFVSRGRVHTIALKKKTKGGAILFKEDLFLQNKDDRDLLEKLSFFKQDSNPVLKLSRDAYAKANGLISEMFSEQTESNDKYILKNYLMILLKLFEKESNHQRIQNNEQTQSPLVKQFLGLIKSDALQFHKVSHYASALFVTPNHLNEKCVDEKGSTALSLIHEQIFLEARRLLAYTEMNIKEVAFACGFEDAAYFNRFFKKLSKQTPQEFRKAL